ncbi:MAG: hypothetical protein AAF567_10010 [Actinomycetota bacterium]
MDYENYRGASPVALPERLSATMRSLARRVRLGLEEAPKFSEILRLVPEGESIDMPVLAVEADPLLVAWYGRVCGRYRVTVADFLVGAFEELRRLPQSTQEQRLSLFRGSFEDVPAPRDKIEVAVGPDLFEWFEEARRRVGLGQAEFVDVCLRSRQAFCSERPAGQLSRPIPPEIAARRKRVSTLREFVESGGLGDESRIFGGGEDRRGRDEQL